ncbi:MAG: hypothetical protein HY726_11090 [Candidatus Rokubacteria bacterium]|nr:hypothetical protein [Candidatus Rokubacteria bacterium]
MSITAHSSLSSVALQVGDALRRHGIRAVLTGGACASLHSGGGYYSVDVDFILLGHVTQAALDAAMASVGFKRTGDRYLHPRARFYVEFPRGPLAIGSDYRIRALEHRLGRARALVLSPTDSCRDRLAAFYHWNDRQSLAVAVSIALRNRVNLAAVRRWSITEGAERRFEEFLAELRAGRRKRSRRIPAGPRRLRR